METLPEKEKPTTETSEANESTPLTTTTQQNLEFYFAKEPLDFLNAFFNRQWLTEWFVRRFLSSLSSLPSLPSLNLPFLQNLHRHPIPPAQGQLLQTGFYYLEGPRIHNGHLYVSDMHHCKVHKLDPISGDIIDTITFQDKVSGLGFLSTGELVVVAMSTFQILKYDEQTKTCQTYADLSPYCRKYANDMVVDVDDHIYVGNFGFDFNELLQARTTTVVHVNPQQKVTLAAKRMYFPNGSLVTPDGKTLIVAETFRGCLTAFDIDRSNDGQLINKRTWAKVDAALDGICLDDQGCVWAAVPKVGAYNTSGCVLRIAEHGFIKECYGFACNGLSACCVATNLYKDESTDHTNQSWLYVLESKTIKEHYIMNKYKDKNSWITRIPVSVGPAKRDDDSRYHAGMC